MAATITLDSGQAGRDASRSNLVRRGTISLNTYSTGGIAVAKADFDFWHSLIDLRVDPSAGYVFEWDKANAKVKAYDNKDPGAAGGADIALPEVGNSTNLASVSARFRAEGR